MSEENKTNKTNEKYYCLRTNKYWSSLDEYFSTRFFYYFTDLCHRFDIDEILKYKPPLFSFYTWCHSLRYENFSSESGADYKTIINFLDEKIKFFEDKPKNQLTTSKLNFLYAALLISFMNCKLNLFSS